MGRGGRMNARGVMERLLSGKVIVERIPGICDEYIRMKGDELEYMGSIGEWREFEHILINGKYVEVVEE